MNILRYATPKAAGIIEIATRLEILDGRVSEYGEAEYSFKGCADLVHEIGKGDHMVGVDVYAIARQYLVVRCGTTALRNRLPIDRQNLPATDVVRGWTGH